jgi:Galactose oxidase, central domain
MRASCFVLVMLAMAIAGCGGGSSQGSSAAGNAGSGQQADGAPSSTGASSTSSSSGSSSTSGSSSSGSSSSSDAPASSSSSSGSGSSSSSDGSSSGGFDVSGSVSGLTNSGLTIQGFNTTDSATVSIASNAATFQKSLPSGGAWSFSVNTQPSTQFCGLSATSVTVNPSASLAVRCIHDDWEPVAATIVSNGAPEMPAWDSATWHDSTSGLWLFGGCHEIVCSSIGNDLWRFDSAAGTWTFISGAVDQGNNHNGSFGTQGVAAAGNIPSMRSAPASWTDHTGNFWLFGGEGYDSIATTTAALSDLWSYNPQTALWTWVGGSNTAGAGGSYGVQGVATPGNAPGARANAVAQIDPAGTTLWLFGGSERNDLWRYSTTTGEWTWVSGAQLAGTSGVYGTQGTAAPGNMPGGRSSAASWLDNAGNLWIFGGQGLDGSGTSGYLNDLWKYDVVGGTWTWVAGSSAVATQIGTIDATLGVAAAGNTPPARSEAAAWRDSAGNFWVAAGEGTGGTGGSPTVLSDLWKYSATDHAWVWMGDAGSHAAGSAVWTDSTGTAYVYDGYDYGHSHSDPVSAFEKYLP